MSGLQYTAKHAATAYTNAASVVFQLTTSAACPITINRVELQSSVTTSSQAVVVLQWGYYATPHAAGTSVTPLTLTKKNTVSSATACRIASATMGTTFTPYREWQWNIALPFDHVLGMDALKIEVPAATTWALILPSASGTPTLSGAIDYSEY
jgi:hypothetical protein